MIYKNAAAKMPVAFLFKNIAYRSSLPGIPIYWQDATQQCSVVATLLAQKVYSSFQINRIKK